MHMVLVHQIQMQQYLDLIPGLLQHLGNCKGQSNIKSLSKWNTVSECVSKTVITYDFNSVEHLARRNLACGNDNDKLCSK